MGLKYGTDESGSVLWPLVFRPNGRQPVDSRTVVEAESDLDITTTFANNHYLGMQVYVEENKTLYILTETTGKGVWTKLPSQKDLTDALNANVKSLFAFKGVASAIDADRCIITVGYATGKDNKQYTIKKQAYDIAKETMYGWQAEGSDAVYWTHESTGTLSPVYTTTGDAAYITRLIYQNEVYYYRSENEYESLDGDVLYVKDNKYFSDSEHQIEVTGVTTDTYHGYKFVEDTAFKLTLTTSEEGGIPAGPDNIGWVYQIGEEEYASNGSIWVQLGSPKENWIVIK